MRGLFWTYISLGVVAVIALILLLIYDKKHKHT